jgi:hypothetical protein
MTSPLTNDPVRDAMWRRRLFLRKPNMTIPTTASLRAARRFQDRRRGKAARVITAMERGAALHLSFNKHGSAWTLSTGVSVTAEVALMVLNDVRIIGCGDGLFGGGPCQTWRYDPSF